MNSWQSADGITRFTGNRRLADMTDFKQNPITALVRKAQDELERRAGSIEHNEAALQQDRFWLRTVTWTLVGTTVFGIGWLGIARTEEVVVAQGQLKPTGGVKEIRIPAGTVVEDILVEQGDQVRKDQVLIRWTKTAQTSN